MCGTEVLGDSQYCHSCGNEIRCKECGTEVLEDSLYCHGCGKEVHRRQPQSDGTLVGPAESVAEPKMTSDEPRPTGSRDSRAESGLLRWLSSRSLAFWVWMFWVILLGVVLSIREFEGRPNRNYVPFMGYKFVMVMAISAGAWGLLIYFPLRIIASIIRRFRLRRRFRGPGD